MGDWAKAAHLAQAAANQASILGGVQASAGLATAKANKKPSAKVVPGG